MRRRFGGAPRSRQWRCRAQLSEEERGEKKGRGHRIFIRRCGAAGGVGGWMPSDPNRTVSGGEGERLRLAGVERAKVGQGYEGEREREGWVGEDWAQSELGNYN